MTDTQVIYATEPDEAFAQEEYAEPREEYAGSPAISYEEPCVSPLIIHIDGGPGPARKVRVIRGGYDACQAPIRVRYAGPRVIAAGEPRAHAVGDLGRRGEFSVQRVRGGGFRVLRARY